MQVIQALWLSSIGHYVAIHTGAQQTQN